MGDLTIEQMHRILNNAPDRAEMWRDMDSVCSPNEIFYYAWFGGALLVHSDGQWIKSIYHQGDEHILDQLQDLKDLRTAITEHEGSASGFEEYIVAKYPNRSAKVLTHRLEDVDGTMFYACKDVQDQFEAWNHQQSKIEQLENLLSLERHRAKALEVELTNSRDYSDKLHEQIEVLEKQQRINSECINNLVQQKADYLHKVTMAIAHLDSFDHSRAGMNQLVRSIESALEALRDES